MHGASVSRQTEFADIVLADPDWVSAEFDAIVAAGFGPPPRFARPTRPNRGPLAGQRRRGRSTSHPPVGDPDATVPPRQRGPPRVHRHRRLSP
jgi:hypothetical protein